MDVDLVRSLWDPEPGWLNTASYGLPPAPAWEELQQALEIWRHGSASWEPWGESTERARRAFARLVQVQPSRVAVGGTVSELLGLVAASLPDPAVRVDQPREQVRGELDLRDDHPRAVRQRGRDQAEQLRHRAADRDPARLHLHEPGEARRARSVDSPQGSQLAEPCRQISSACCSSSQAGAGGSP